MQRFITTLLTISGFCAGLVLYTAQAATPSVTFHFYGAKDCPPCMAFKRDGLAKVEAAARQSDFAVAVNVIAKTRDVANLGSYGNTDALLRQAASQLDVVYPPIFFVTRDGVVVSVHAGNWQDAQARAEQEARSTGS